jgi:hypothetical protein
MPLAKNPQAGVPVGATPKLHDLPTVTFATHGCVMAYWGNVGVVVWGVESSLSLLEEVRRLTTRVASEHSRLSMVHISLGASPLPSKAVRTGFDVLGEEFAARTDQTAVLIGDTGFWASAVRSFMTSFLLNKRHMKVKLCGSLAEVSRWIAQANSIRTGQLVDPLALQQAMEWVLDRPELSELRGKLADSQPRG